MPFALFICGPRVNSLAEAGPAIVEEIAGRAIPSQVVSTVPANATGVFDVTPQQLPQHLAELAEKQAAAVVLLQENSLERRENLIDTAEEAVVVDWCRAEDTEYQRSKAAHCEVVEEQQVIEGMAQVFAVLEGLGYLPFADRGTLSPQEDAELVEKLKELGYV